MCLRTGLPQAVTVLHWSEETTLLSTSLNIPSNIWKNFSGPQIATQTVLRGQTLVSEIVLDIYTATYFASSSKEGKGGVTLSSAAISIRIL